MEILAQVVSQLRVADPDRAADRVLPVNHLPAAEQAAAVGAATAADMGMGTVMAMDTDRAVEMAAASEGETAEVGAMVRVAVMAIPAMAMAISAADDNRTEVQDFLASDTRIGASE